MKRSLMFAAVSLLAIANQLHAEEQVPPAPVVPAADVPAADVPAADVPAADLPATADPVNAAPSADVPAVQTPVKPAAAVEVDEEADPAPVAKPVAPEVVPAAIAAPAVKRPTAAEEDEEDAPKPAPVPKPVAGQAVAADQSVAPFPDRRPVFEDVSSVTRNYIDPDLIADPPDPLTIFGDGFWRPGQVSDGRFTPNLIMYGDLRTVYAAFQKPDAGNKSDVKTVQAKLDLQFNLQLTATERVHASFQPLTNNGQNTRTDFEPHFDREFEHSLKPVTLFFEGELDSIISDFGGAAQHDSSDLNYALAVGLFPFELHNGYLMSDVFKGIGVTKNNISVPWASNFGVGVVYADSDVSANTALDVTDNAFKMLTVHSFADLAYVRTEASLSWLGTNDESDVAAGQAQDLLYAGLSFSWLRGPVGQGLHLFGQLAGDDTGDGALVVYESNYRLTPINVEGGTYLMVDGFYGSQNWTSISGNLNQVGTTFQSDGITGFPSQNNTGEDSGGGSLAIEYKTLRRRLHFIPEVSYVDDRSGANDDTLAMGLRVNYGFGRRSVLRMDLRRFFPDVGEVTNAGRVEYQVKF